jgi:hypothetical protein
MTTAVSPGAIEKAWSAAPPPVPGKESKPVGPIQVILMDVIFVCTKCEKVRSRASRLARLALPGKLGLMSSEALDCVEAVLRDLLFAAPPPSVTWTASSRQPPLHVRLRRAEEDFAYLAFDGPDPFSAAVEFALLAQERLQAELCVPLPPCPLHGESLVPRRVLAGAEWRCPSGDVSCALGEYSEILWPPPPGTTPDPGLVSDRQRRRGLAFVSLGVETRGGRPVVSASLTEGADQAALAHALAPLELEVTRWLPAPKTMRSDDEVDRSGQHYRALTYLGGFGQLARLAGQLQGPAPGDAADVLIRVAGSTLAPVRLLPEHHIGETEGALVLDAQDRRFAGVGENVVCAGGFGPATVVGEDAVFVAWEIRVVAQKDAGP